MTDILSPTKLSIGPWFTYGTILLRPTQKDQLPEEHPFVIDHSTGRMYVSACPPLINFFQFEKFLEISRKAFPTAPVVTEVTSVTDLQGWNLTHPEPSIVSKNGKKYNTWTGYFNRYLNLNMVVPQEYDLSHGFIYFHFLDMLARIREFPGFNEFVDACHRLPRDINVLLILPISLSIFDTISLENMKITYQEVTRVLISLVKVKIKSILVRTDRPHISLSADEDDELLDEPHIIAPFWLFLFLANESILQEFHHAVERFAVQIF